MCVNCKGFFKEKDLCGKCNKTPNPSATIGADLHSDSSNSSGALPNQSNGSITAQGFHFGSVVLSDSKPAAKANPSSNSESATGGFQFGSEPSTKNEMEKSASNPSASSASATGGFRFGSEPSTENAMGESAGGFSFGTGSFNGSSTSTDTDRSPRHRESPLVETVRTSDPDATDQTHTDPLSTPEEVTLHGDRTLNEDGTATTTNNVGFSCPDSNSSAWKTPNRNATKHRDGSPLAMANGNALTDSGDGTGGLADPPASFMGTTGSGVGAGDGTLVSSSHEDESTVAGNNVHHGVFIQEMDDHVKVFKLASGNLQYISQSGHIVVAGPAPNHPLGLCGRCKNRCRDGHVGSCHSHPSI